MTHLHKKPKRLRTPIATHSTHSSSSPNATTPTTRKLTLYAILQAVVIGALMGLAAKLVDRPEVNPVFDDLGGRLGIWVFAATLIAVYSRSPKVAAARVFAFFLAMLGVYYVYTVLFLGFYPQREILFWGICAVISPVCGYGVWYARGHGWIAASILALPVAVLLTEGFALRYAYLPVHMHYYLIPILMGIYGLFILILLFAVPSKKIHLVMTIPLALGLAVLATYFAVFERIFGGMNGVL